MPDPKYTYRVHISGHVEAKAVVEVQAEDEDEAREIVERQIMDGDELPWVVEEYIEEQVGVDEVEDVTP